MNSAIFLSIITQLSSIYLIYLIAIAISSWQIIGKHKQNLYKVQQVSREKLYRNFKYHLESLSRFTEEKAWGIIINYQLSIINYQLSIINYQLFPTPRDNSVSFRVSLIQFTLSKAGKMKPLNESLF